ncbi:MAG: TraB/GumN family protein [Thermodesulfovibrionales bacterium]|nr:TraB/GumN family protein [Thermodesulfovibrionales bacterium]
MVNKRIKIALGCWILLFSILFCSTDGFSQNNKNFLWKVTSGRNTVSILGSLHFMKKEAYPLDRKIEEVFDASDVVVVEANLNDIARIDVQKLIDTAFYTGDETLESHVSAETYSLVKKQYEKLGIPLWLVSRQKPWFLALTITSFELAKLGFDPNYGIEMHFTSKASGKKRIEELESFEYQINLLSGFSDREQEIFLLETLKDVQAYEAEAEADALLRAWQTGDIKRLESIVMKNVSDDERLSLVYEKLMYQRNRNMTSKIEEYLKKRETYFVIVGAGHLVGDRGILELLKSKGYTIEQL